MTPAANETHLKDDTPDEANRVWDEYKYRHEHCWKTLFQTTSAAVIMGIVPYLDSPPRADDKFKWVLVVPPLIAVALIVSAMVRMKEELLLLARVKERHRIRQKHHYGFSDLGLGTFDRHVRLYLWILLTLGLGNLAISALWLSAR